MEQRGLAGVGVSTLMIAFNVPIYYHLLSVAIVVLLVALITYRFLLDNDRAKEGNKLVFGKPDKFIGALGLMVFLLPFARAACLTGAGSILKKWWVKMFLPGAT